MNNYAVYRIFRDIVQNTPSYEDSMVVFDQMR